ncbi:MAG TPA: CPBP family intramembrane glutamic endopeptidase, partial [Candidatus Angelobacter sp.]
ALLFTNLRVSPRIPWSAAVMAVVLWVMWQYLGGRWWPRRTAEARRRNLRASAVSSRTFVWALVGGVFLIAALSGLWIVFFQVSRTPANVLPDMSRYPLLTVVATLLMSSLAAPFSEEAAFRGYAQSILERNFRAPTAIVISSTLFAAAHLTHGFFWTKLSVYFLFGVAAGVTARLANSILPSIVVHAMADLTFFVLVWPRDATRRLVTEGGADTWFWIHVAQVVVCAPVAIWCLRQLVRSTEAPASRTMPVTAGG